MYVPHYPSTLWFSCFSVFEQRDYLPLSHLTYDSNYDFDHYYHCIYIVFSRLKRCFSNWEEKSIALFHKNYLQITSNNLNKPGIIQSEVAPNWKKCSRFKLCCSLHHVWDTNKHMILLIILRSVTLSYYIYYDTTHIKLWKLQTLIRTCSLPGQWQYFIWEFSAKKHAQLFFLLRPWVVP